MRDVLCPPPPRLPPDTPESDRAHPRNGGGGRPDPAAPTRAATYLSFSPGMLSVGGLQLQGHVMASGNCCWEGLRGRRQKCQDVVPWASGACPEPGPGPSLTTGLLSRKPFHWREEAALGATGTQARWGQLGCASPGSLQPSGLLGCRGPCPWALPLPLSNLTPA